MAICGPKLSLCGVIISAWGIVQLALMGLFYYIHAVALAEDIPAINETQFNVTTFYQQVDAGYTQNAYNCLTAALLYLVTLTFCAYQFWLNNRSSLSI